MFEDILKKNTGLKWDFDKYANRPYCPACGSEYLTTTKENLSSKYLEKTIKCDVCAAEWSETWDKNIKLGLKRVSICRT